MTRADCGFNQVAPLQLTPSSALEHAENADTLWDRISLKIGELPLDPLENSIDILMCLLTGQRPAYFAAIHTGSPSEYSPVTNVSLKGSETG